MREIVERVAPEFGASIEERDVHSNAETSRRYALAIPVLLLGATELARHRIDEAELRRRLGAALSEPGA